MIQVELVGGEYDGQVAMAEEGREFLSVLKRLLVDGERVSGAEMMQYGWTGRTSPDGLPLYKLLNHVIGKFDGESPPG